MVGRFTRAATARSGYEDPDTLGKDHRRKTEEREALDRQRHVYEGTNEEEFHNRAVEGITET